MISLDRVLTLGAGGMIGRYVDFGMRPTHEELDVLDEDAVMRYVEECQPSAIIYLAGATDTQTCESDPLYAYELNVRGVYNAVRAARVTGATLVYASTSRVFKGDKEGPYTESDIPEPTTKYGLTKYLGEVVAATAPRAIIARTAWVFGGGPLRDTKFYGKMLGKLRAGDSDIVALNDVQGSPTYAKDYVEAIKDLLTTGKEGIFHITNAGSASRFELAEALAKELGVNTPVRAVDRSHFAGVTLPANEAVVSEKIHLRPWKEALSEYLATEWA